MARTENTAFTDRAIAKAQHTALGQPFCSALNDYLMRHERISWDEAHKLFWVTPPKGPMQVAVWLMPVAEMVGNA